MSLSQVLAPQLQQSLALLQAPTLELKALVEQEVQQNPCLEEVPTAEMEQMDRNRDEGSPANDPSDLAEPPADVMFDPATEKPSSAPVDDFRRSSRSWRTWTRNGGTIFRKPTCRCARGRRRRSGGSSC